MTIRDIAVAFGFEVDRNSEKQTKDSINGIGTLAKKVLGAIGVVFTIKGMSDLAQAAADAEALESQFTQVFGDMEEEATQKLQAIADEGGSLVNRMKGSFTQLAAFTKTTGANEAEALAIAERGMYAAADSAAFYDRSLEDVTNSLQSFLKGNFEQDAALGLSCTEVTRNAAANKLYGKSFKDLSEYQKQLVLLQMVEEANELSGAIGQAARESDTWTNQLGNLKQSIRDIKAAAGSTFLKPAVEILKGLTMGAQQLHGLIKRAQPTVERFTSGIVIGLKQGATVVKFITDRLGGLENVLKLLVVIGTSFALVIAFTKAKSGVLALVKAFKSLDKATLLARLKIVGIIAAIALLFLIFEDFFQFMKGNDSVIGTLLEKAGIDVDGVRTKINDSFAKVKEMFFAVWGAIVTYFTVAVNAISTVARAVFGALKMFWDAWGDKIIQAFTIWANHFKTFFDFVITTITLFANLLSAIFSGDIDGALELLKQIFANVFAQILDIIKGIFEIIWVFIGDKVTSIKDMIIDGFNAAIEFITSLPEKAVQWGADFIDGLVEGITSGIENVTKAVKGVADKVKSFLHFSVPDEGPLTDYENWMPDFMQGLAGGIDANRDVVLDKVRNLTGNMEKLMSAAVARVTTAATTAITNTTSNITQNVNINNSYSGGSMETQKNVSKAMKKSAVDATTQMARSLAYARG